MGINFFDGRWLRYEGEKKTDKVWLGYADVGE
jgi:hypothetical protein